MVDGMFQLLRLVGALGQIRGRKKFQKIVHILQSAGHEFPYYFDYLHYGPFSSELASEINYLAGSELMREDPPTSDGEPYVYSPGTRLPAVLDRAGMNDEPEWIVLAKCLNDEDAEFLEAVSTILYLRRCRFEGEALERHFSQLKPKLSARFNDACEFEQRVMVASSNL
jgi:uncharacterized protein YwgA